MKRILKINPDAKIGTVIYIVEGQSTEFILLRTIYGKILNYDYIEQRRGKPARFIDNSCPHNRVFVINTSESNISDISDVDFLDKICEYMINEYGMDLDNSAKFYIFDRDKKSNTNKELIEYYLKVLAEPYGDDTEYEKGGLLLLSYPAIESFILSNFIEDTYEMHFKLGKQMKTFIGEPQNKCIQINKITAETLEFAALEFLKYLDSVDTEFDLENLSDANAVIFEEEEKLYEKEAVYAAVSQLILSLLYLGIIKIEEV